MRTASPVLSCPHREAFLRRDLNHAAQQVLAVRRHKVGDVEYTSLNLGRAGVISPDKSNIRHKNFRPAVFFVL